MNDVRKYYNDHMEEEDRRLDEHPFEVPITLHFVKKYMKPGNQLFDIACGTGRIASILLNMGYYVGLNDLSDRNIGLVKKRLHSNDHVLFIDRSDALECNKWNERKWDGILVLGPLYHMINKEKRLNILSLACKNLKPGGYLFSSFMTRTGAMVYGIKHNPRGILYPDGAKKLWETGSDNRFIESTKYFTNAYFDHPEEINPLIEEAGLKPLHLLGAEGVFGERFELYHRLETHLKEAWMKFIIDNCEDPHMVQQSKHLLSVACKPK